MKATVLDSYAMLAYLEREEGYKQVASRFERSVTHGDEIFLCVVNWGEVMYNTLRKKGEQTAQLAEDTMRSLPIHIIDAGKELTLQAARYKAIHKMSFADAYAAALAKLKKAELITGDKEFKPLEKEIKILWI
jgi:ribonuclease VapC